ncbi:hypothetical protein [Flavobacterium filum]|uniref:hypothetical protein n=1 Tax=Flavobacterium filum TaxID=370974 RepID=UPI0023EFE2F4|nr:hypothetical protein [Flavobacterium filum]
MAEANELTSEEVAKQLEATKAELDKFKSDLDFQKSEAKKAFEKRDEYKQELEKLKNKDLETNNQFKELYEKEKENATTLTKQLEELNPYKEKWTTWETTRRETLLAKVTDEDLKKVYQKYELTDLEVVVAKLEAKPLSTEGGRGGGTFNYDGKKWDDISSANKEKLAKDQPDLYRKLYYEKYRKEPVI